MSYRSCLILAGPVCKEAIKGFQWKDMRRIARMTILKCHGSISLHLKRKKTWPLCRRLETTALATSEQLLTSLKKTKEWLNITRDYSMSWLKSSSQLARSQMSTQTDYKRSQGWTFRGKTRREGLVRDKFVNVMKTTEAHFHRSSPSRWNQVSS